MNRWNVNVIQIVWLPFKSNGLSARLSIKVQVKKVIKQSLKCISRKVSAAAIKSYGEFSWEGFRAEFLK